MVAEIGRLCVKSAGRESGKECVVVDLIDENFVLIDGLEVKRRRCNVKHLEPLNEIVEISRGSSSDQVERKLKEAEFRGST